MKKFYYLCLMAGLTFGSLTFTACGDDDDSNNNQQQNDNNNGKDSTTVVPNSDAVTVDDLIGIWSVNSTDNEYVAEFTKDEIILKANGKVEYQSKYTLKDGVISYSGLNDMQYQSVPGLLYGKSVMVIKQLYNNGQDEDVMLGMILFKQGKTITATKNDIQGTWCWAHPADDIRMAFKFDGDNFEVILPAWGQKYVGDYPYTNGFVKFHLTGAYTAREEHTGYGDGNGRLNPVTLECDDWRVLDKENWHPEIFNDGMFIVNGEDAYGYIGGPGVYKKKK
jgi:hypothetical protein